MLKRTFRLLETDFSVYSAIFGYIFGLILPFFTGCETDIPELSSVFLQNGGFSLFLKKSAVQAIYPISVFILGFIPFSSLISSTIIFFRSALTAFAAFMLTTNARPDLLYFVHTISGICTVFVMLAISKSAVKFSHSSDTSAEARLYTLKFLFFSGILMLILFCREIAIAFI